MNPKKEISIIAALCSIITIFVVVFGIWPIFEKVRENSQTLIETEREMDMLDVKSENFEESEDSFFALEINKDLAEFFIDPDIDNNFIEFLEGLAQDLSVPIEVSRYTFKKQEGDIWFPHGYKISCSGPFQNILRMVGKLETSPYLIEINSLEIRRTADEETEQEYFSASFLIKGYSR